MELTKHHRESLLSTLDKAIQEKENAESMLNKMEDKTAVLKGFWEMDIFLAEERIELIRKSLIDNKVDF